MNPLRVLAEGADWYAVAKPSGLACHRSSLVHDRVTVVSVLERQRGERPHLVHRLDRAASGVLLIGRTPEATHRLHTALHQPDATKVYLAFTRGFFRWDDPVDVDTPMKDDQGIVRDARTVIDVLGRSQDPRCSLLRACPATGRYHQVRRHCRDLGHPLLMDHQHGDTRVNVTWRQQTSLRRLGLHAWHVETPETGRICCPPPDDLVAVWRTMPWWNEAVAATPELGEAPLVLRVADRDDERDDAEPIDPA